MQLSRTTRQSYAAMVVCLVVAGAAYLLRIFDVAPFCAHLKGVHVITYACYVLFVFIWLRLMRYRLLSRHVLRCVRAATLVMLVWLLVRTVKYEYSFGMRWLARYTWYFYYVGYAYAPALLFLAMLHVGKRVGERIDRRWRLLLVGATALAALVLTNDLHQQAFNFANAPVQLQTDRDPYAYGWVYYAVWVWLIVLAVACMAVAMVRCARTPGRTALVTPVGILAVGICYFVAMLLVPGFSRYTPYKTPEFTCIITVLFMESLVVLGLFPSNERYDELWRASSLSGGLVDGRGMVVDAAHVTERVSVAQVEQALRGPVALPYDRVLAARHVHGGVAFWIRDFSRVHALQAQLAELGDTLQQENAVLAAENDLAHERQALAQRQALYDVIAQRTAGHRARLEELLASLPADNDAFLAAMRRVAVEATYVKRCANLTLLGELGAIDVRELALAAEETCGWLRSCGAVASVYLTGAGAVAATEAQQAYDSFYEALERVLAHAENANVACEIDQGHMDLWVREAQGLELHRVVSFSQAGAQGRTQASAVPGNVAQAVGGAAT